MTTQPQSPHLYLVTDEAACLGRDFYWIVEEAVQGGVTMVQLREKTMSTRAFIDRAKRLKDILAPYHVPLIINDRVDVALAVDAEGVHVGQSDMPFELVNQLLPPGKIIGISAERQQDVLEAENWDISYLAVSPLFSTSTKTDLEKPWEMEGLKWVKQNSSQPIAVIGGLNGNNIREAVQNGAEIVAVVSAICSAPSPYEAAFRLKEAMRNNQ